MKWLALLAPVQELLLKQLSQVGLVENLVRKENFFFSYSTFWRFLHIPSMWAWTLDQTKNMIKEADWFEQYLASVVCIAHSCPAAFTQAAEPSWSCGKFGRAPLFGSHHDIVVYFTRYQANMNIIHPLCSAWSGLRYSLLSSSFYWSSWAKLALWKTWSSSLVWIPPWYM